MPYFCVSGASTTEADEWRKTITQAAIDLASGRIKWHDFQAAQLAFCIGFDHRQPAGELREWLLARLDRLHVWGFTHDAETIVVTYGRAELPEHARIEPPNLDGYRPAHFDVVDLTHLGSHPIMTADGVIRRGPFHIAVHWQQGGMA